VGCDGSVLADRNDLPAANGDGLVPNRPRVLHIDQSRMTQQQFRIVLCGDRLRGQDQEGCRREKSVHHFSASSPPIHCRQLTAGCERPYMDAPTWPSIQFVRADRIRLQPYVRTFAAA
jgi:hypothetical protein